ncbi:MAG TPA: PAS domain-containing sensor histidine kinase [Methanoregula sp.]|nr:PAS domain-containing sensor histidine kinase [Methanoregula sp.]
MQDYTATEQKKDHDALQGYEEKYCILTEMMPLGVFRVGPGPEYTVLSANRMLAQMLGYDSADSVIGISARDIMYNTAHWQQIESDLVSKGAINGYELQLRQKEGTEIFVAVSARSAPAPDLQIAWIEGVVEDITERKMLEMEMNYHTAELSRYASSLTQANKKLNLLSSITRHDILNQLTALVGYLELMGEESDDPKIQKYIDVEKKIADTIRKQIQFTRDYQDIGVQSPQWYNVKKTIEKVTAPLPLSNGTLRISIENLIIYADPLLEKVFYNLVENALRHGKDVSRITFFSVLSGDTITIVCEDNGEGIPKEYKEAIFNRQHFKNTGFGLFLSREILGITGLSIRETGEPGKGGRFEITGPPGYFRIEDQVV